MISKCLLALILANIAAFGFADDDFDGVENNFDKCPNTSLYELADLDGCPKTTLSAEPSFDVQIGFHYYKNQLESSTSTSFESNVYIDRINFEVAFSPSDSQNEDESDSSSLDLNLFYKFEPSYDIATWLGGGASIPTSKSSQNNEQTNYSLFANTSKEFEDLDLFAGISYTFVNSKDTEDAKYKNTFGYYFGGKYYLDDFISYDIQYSKTTNDIIDESDIENLYFGTNYNLSKNWFNRFEISAGLSDSADDFGFSTKIGYSF